MLPCLHCSVVTTKSVNRRSGTVPAVEITVEGADARGEPPGRGSHVSDCFAKTTGVFSKYTSIIAIPVELRIFSRSTGGRRAARQACIWADGALRTVFTTGVTAPCYRPAFFNSAQLLDPRRLPTLDLQVRTQFP